MVIAIERGRVVIDDALVQRGADALMPKAEPHYALSGYSTGLIKDSEQAQDNRRQTARDVLKAALWATPESEDTDGS